MKKYIKQISLALLLSAGQWAAVGQTIGTTINLNATNAGGIYLGSQKVTLGAGFSFSANNGNFFKASATNLTDPTVTGNMASANAYQSTVPTDLSGRSLNAAAPVGTIPGSFVVSPTGAATYSMPIQVVPGTNGMQPNLAVVYNSQGGNSILGKGWDLAGLSCIYAVPRDNKGVYFPIGEDYNLPNYMLDGQPLLVNYYGYEIPYEFHFDENAQFFRTENNAFHTVKKQYNAFTVTSHDGTVRSYGATANARSANSKWYLDKVTDLQGNYLTYTYMEKGGQMLVASISYTGNTAKGIMPYAFITFSYDERSDPSFGFGLGRFLNQKYLLRTISVAEGGAVVRRYAFNYALSTSGSLLTSVGLTDGAGVALNETKFAWNASAATEEIVENELTEQLKNDWGVFNTTHKQVVVGNIDDDGKTDVLSYWKENSAVKIEIRSSKSKTVLYTANCPNPLDYDVTVESADFNGDGLSDVVVRTSYPGQVYDNSNKAHILLSPLYNEVKTVVLPNEISKYDIGDYNNDGYDEMISLFKGSNGLLYYHFVLYAPDTKTIDGSFTAQKTSYTHNFDEFKFGDFWGDGRKEILVMNGSGSMIIKFNSYISLSYLSIPSLTTATRILCTGDFNGDGRTDILEVPEGEECATYRIGMLVGDKFDFSYYNEGKGHRFYSGLPNYVPDAFGMYDHYVKKMLKQGTGDCKCQKDGYDTNDCYIWPHSWHLRRGKTYQKKYAISRDINNDGYDDLILSKISSVVAVYSYRAKYVICNNTGDDTLHYQNIRHQDIIYINDHHGGFDSVMDKSIHATMNDRCVTYTIGDFNGDGLLDIVYSNLKDNDRLGEYSSASGYFNAKTNHSATTLSQISDGLKNLTSIGYGTISDANVHTPEQPSNNNFFTRVTEKAVANSNENSVLIYRTVTNETGGIKQCNYPLRVVKSFTQANTAATLSTTLNYTGARMDLYGRGFLGFSSVTAALNGGGGGIDGKSVTYFNLDSRKRPYVASSYQYFSDGKLKQSSSNVLQELQDNRDERIYSPCFKSGSSTDGLTNNANSYSIEYDSRQMLINEYQALFYTKWFVKTKTTTNGVSTQTATTTSTDDLVFGTSPNITQEISTQTVSNGKTETSKQVLNFTNKELSSSLAYRNGALLGTTTRTKSGNTLSTKFTPADATNSSPSRSTTATYDGTWRYVTRQTDPLGNTVSTQYNTALGLPTMVTDETHSLSSLNSYSGFGVPTEISLPTGEKISFTSSLDGGKIKKTATSSWYPSQTSTESYDALGRKVEATGYGYGNSKIEYKNTITASQNTETRSGALAVVTNFDSYGRVHDLQQGTYTVAYDYSGNTITQTENTNTISSLEYNVNGTLKSVTDPLKTSIIYSYDPLGQLTNTKNGADPAISSKFDNLGQTELKDPDAGTTSYKYNGYGELYSQTDAKNNKTVCTYDALGRVKICTITPASGSAYTIENTWDTKYKGALSKVEQKAVGVPNVVIEYEYDAMGRCASRTQTLGDDVFTYSYQYDTYGRLQFLTYPNTTLILQYFYNNRDVVKITNATNQNVIWELLGSSNGKITDTKLSGGKIVRNRIYKENTTYLTDIKAGLSATPTSIQNYHFVWDEKTGNLSSRNDVLANKTESFTYDKLDRLETITGATSQTMIYSPTGNINNNSQIGLYTYSGAQPHALTYVPSLLYNPNAQTVNFNATGMIDKISQTLASGTACYDITYNPEQQRCKTVYSYTGKPTIRRSYFDSYEKTEIDGVPADYYCYITTPEGLTALYKSGKMYYLFTDHLGSIVAVSDANGTVLERYSYDAWGRPRDPQTWTALATDNAYEPSRITNRGYTGHEHLFTFGLINMNARIYDQTLARFLSPDSYITDPYNTQCYNRYAYCRNNPLNRIDPSGNQDGPSNSDWPVNPNEDPSYYYYTYYGYDYTNYYYNYTINYDNMYLNYDPSYGMSKTGLGPGELYKTYNWGESYSNPNWKVSGTYDDAGSYGGMYPVGGATSLPNPAYYEMPNAATPQVNLPKELLGNFAISNTGTITAGNYNVLDQWSESNNLLIKGTYDAIDGASIAWVSIFGFGAEPLHLNGEPVSSKDKISSFVSMAAMLIGAAPAETGVAKKVTEEVVESAANIADDAFVHVTTPNGANNILSKGLDPEISGFVTKWKYVKNVTNPSDFNTMLYKQNLWEQTAGKFDNGFNILKIDATPIFYSPRTNWVNGIPQYRFNHLIDPSLITKIK